MTSYCVIIEGQLRGSQRCGPTIRRHVIDPLGADLVIYAQHTPEYDTEKCARHYGPAAYFHAYENPTPDFSEIFDALRAELKYDFNWRDTFKQIRSYNYHLGFDRPGTCIRRMYNRHLLYRHLQNADYDRYILMRSDLYFLADFPIHACADPNTLHSADVMRWRGINNNLLVFGAPLREKVLNYITLFLDGSIARLGHSPTPLGMNEEEFFHRAMTLQSVNSATFKHNWFISADSLDELTTWKSNTVHQHPNGQLYKYKDEFEQAFEHAGLPLLADTPSADTPSAGPPPDACPSPDGQTPPPAGRSTPNSTEFKTPGPINMNRTCVIIEGQLRGSRRCGPNMREHLIDALGADLIIHAQHTPEYDAAECAERYGPAADYRAYENPSPDFSEIFDALRAELKYDFDWRDMFKQIKSANYYLGFDSPGTCIRRMYNRHMIHRQLSEANYDWYILTRSDMFFLDDFPMHQCTDPNTLYSTAVGCWRGINNNLLVFGAPLREKVLNYITLFLDGSMARIGNLVNTRGGMVEEEFCKRAMDLQQVNQATINHNWFISADSENEVCTWKEASIHQHANGQLYKYQEEFESAYRNAGLPL